MTATAIDEKYERLQTIIRELGRVTVAFSAGVDSTLLLKVCLDVLGAEHVLAITGRSDSVPRDELREAQRLAKELGAEHATVDTDEFDNADYLRNPTHRCYFCKDSLYTHMAAFVAKRGHGALVSGTNADDLGDFRPGLIAADEHRVRAPLAEAGMTKRDVRELSNRLGLPTHDKPAGPCLSSRVAYGEAITPEKLRMIESAEAFLHKIGIRECRVRHHNNLARIEVPADLIATLAHRENRARIDAHFRSLGYAYVTVDLRGFRSGSMNEVIPLETLQTASRGV